MNFLETKLKGSYLIELEKNTDERGFFARSYCRKEFEKYGLNSKVVQCNISFNKKKQTLRGMHYQTKPYEEAKLIRCTHGAIYDVIIDLRPDSSTYLKHYGVQLNEDNRLMLFVPEGFAHGFITLQDRTEIFYQMSEFYAPESAMGLRYNDPLFGIKWPEDAKIISNRDKNYPDFKP